MNGDNEVFVIGAGGHAKVVISTLLAAGFSVAGIYDDDEKKWGTSILRVPILGSISQLTEESKAVQAIGKNSIRKDIARRIPSADWITVVHPQAAVHPTATLGKGTVVFAGSVIQPDVVIGQHCIINTAATVDHDCVLADFVHLAPGCHLAGEVRIGEGAFLGIGSVVIPGMTIGSWSVIGAGGVVIRAVENGVISTGVPARMRRRIKDQG